jgi:DNA-binding transcriptional ArsR family regulator
MTRTLLTVVVVGLAVSGGVHAGSVAATAHDSESQSVYRQSPTDALADAADTLQPSGSSTPSVSVPLGLSETPLVLLPPLAYSRHDSSDPLAHETRQSLYDHVLESPGTYVAEAATATDTPVSTVRYHLRILSAEDLVYTEHIRGKKRILPTGVESSPLHAALNDETTARLVDEIRRQDRPTISRLAATVDRATSTVSYHVSRLESDGLVERRRHGTTIVVSLSSTAAIQSAE